MHSFIKKRLTFVHNKYFSVQNFSSIILSDNCANFAFSQLMIHCGPYQRLIHSFMQKLLQKRLINK